MCRSNTRRHSFNDTGPDTDPRRIEEARSLARWKNFSFKFEERPSCRISKRLKELLASMRV